MRAPDKIEIGRDRWIFVPTHFQKYPAESKFFLGLRNGIGIGYPREAAIKLRDWLDHYLAWSKPAGPSGEKDGAK